MKEEYYNGKDEVVREFLAEEIKEVEGVSTITKRTMIDMKKGNKTTVAFSSIDYNVGVDADLFSERYLRQAPREYVQ